MLERFKNPHPADDGVDPRHMCLVVFLCEGGHHVTDWVSPGSMRPCLRHAAAYPYKNKASVGTARLQVILLLLLSLFLFLYVFDFLSFFL